MLVTCLRCPGMAMTKRADSIWASATGLVRVSCLHALTAVAAISSASVGDCGWKLPTHPERLSLYIMVINTGAGRFKMLSAGILGREAFWPASRWIATLAIWKASIWSSAEARRACSRGNPCAAGLVLNASQKQTANRLSLTVVPPTPWESSGQEYPASCFPFPPCLWRPTGRGRSRAPAPCLPARRSFQF